MATLDFGFDYLPGLLSNAFGRDESAHPPHNIEKCAHASSKYSHPSR
jgi:hypothetical protein